MRSAVEWVENEIGNSQLPVLNRAKKNIAIHDILKKLPPNCYHFMMGLPEYDVKLYLETKKTKYIKRCVSVHMHDIFDANVEIIETVLHDFENIRLIDNFVDKARQFAPNLIWVKFWEK
jgi:hypothetical protein